MSIHIGALINGVLTPQAATPFKFPGGETHLKFSEFNEKVTWVADVRGAVADDLIALGMVADVSAERGDQLAVLLPYLPGARADKGQPEGAYVYAGIVNSFGAGNVIALDPHSQMAAGWWHNLTAADTLPLVLRAINQAGAKFDGVIAPDIGAKDRAEAVAVELGVDVYQVRKTRDFDSGKILRIDAPVIPRLGKYLVVDDICDGGGTFRGVAAATALSRENLSLWITHGIFSGEADKLRHSYRDILTTDSHPGCFRVGVATQIVPTFSHMFQTLLGKLNV